ncbi:unnamed protein product [Ascophyllum nodosum]
MGGSPPSLSLAHDLLRELRQGTRRIEVVNSSGRRINDDSWTKDAIETFNNWSIRTVASCRDALVSARFEAEQRNDDIGAGSESLAMVLQAERDLEHVRSELRRAIIARKRSEERRQNSSGRAALLGTGTTNNGVTKRQNLRGRGQEDAPGSAEGQAREMEQSLKRTRKMMAEQLARVAQVSEVMGEQDVMLRDTFAEHQARRCMYRQDGIGGSLRRAGTTLTRLSTADVMDKVVMVASTMFFFSTVCFILYQRLPMLGLL